MNTDCWTAANKFVSNLKGDEYAQEKIVNEIYEHMDKSKEYAFALADEAFNRKLMVGYKFDEIKKLLGINTNTYGILVQENWLSFN